MHSSNVLHHSEKYVDDSGLFLDMSLRMESTNGNVRGLRNEAL